MPDAPHAPANDNGDLQIDRPTLYRVARRFLSDRLATSLVSALTVESTKRIQRPSIRPPTEMERRRAVSVGKSAGLRMAPRRTVR